MRKLLSGVGLAVALAVPMSLPAIAANLHDAHEGTTVACGDNEIARWHFVNNQTEGERVPQFLTAYFDGSQNPVIVEAYKVNRNVQHFAVVGGNKLDTAHTPLPGKLVLSDVSCRDDKKK